MYITPSAECIVSIEILHDGNRYINRYKVNLASFPCCRRFEQASNDLSIFNYTSMHGSTPVKVDQVGTVDPNTSAMQL